GVPVIHVHTGEHAAVRASFLLKDQVGQRRADTRRGGAVHVPGRAPVPIVPPTDGRRQGESGQKQLTCALSNFTIYPRLARLRACATSSGEVVRGGFSSQAGFAEVTTHV